MALAGSFFLWRDACFTVGVFSYLLGKKAQFKGVGTMNIGKTGLTLVAAATVGVFSLNGTALAALVDWQNHQDPASTTYFQNWDRGDALTSFAHWDRISEDDVLAPGVQDHSPDGAFVNLASAPLDSSPPSFVTGGGLGGNIYSFTGDYTVTLNMVPDYATPDGLFTVALQLKTIGNTVDPSTVSLNGLGGNYTLLFNGPNPGPWGGEMDEHLFVWTDVASASSYDIVFTNIVHTSLDELTVDMNAVPLPGAVFLFGTALAGLIGFRRRERG